MFGSAQGLGSVEALLHLDGRQLGSPTGEIAPQDAAEAKGFKGSGSTRAGIHIDSGPESSLQG